MWEAEVTKHTRSATAFHFNEFLKIIKPTGQQAQSLRELIGIIRAAEPDVIYHHMCRGYLKYTPQLWDYPNDFARWATHGLGTQVLAERLANINPFEHGNIEELRQNIIYVIEDFMWENQYTPPVRPGFEFHFERSTGIILPTRRYAKTLPQFCDALARSGVSVVYYHFFESRIRLEGNMDDFSNWIESNFDLPQLVASIRRLDFYLNSLEDLRRRLIQLVKDFLKR